MKVLVTGGAGFIGSHITERLLGRGDSVYVIDNLATGRVDNLPEHLDLQFVDDTIAAEGVVREFCGQWHPELIVHCAASYQNPDDWVEDVDTNVLGTVNVVKAAKATGVKRIIYFQTSLCYGTAAMDKPIALDQPLAPAVAYAITKTAAEQFIQMSGLDYVSFRLANCYGPRNLSGPAPTFYKRLTSGKGIYAAKTRRDFIFVDDLVDLVMQAVDGKGHGVYHASSGSDYSIKALADAVVKGLGLTGHSLGQVPEVERQPDDVYRILLDPSRTRQDFGGWTPTVPLETGIARAIEWYRTHSFDKTFTHLRNYKQD